MMGLLGKKLGMTQIFDTQGNEIPVTVIQAGPCVVTQKKLTAKEGYDAVQVGFEEVPEKKTARLGKPRVGHFKKNNLKAHRVLKEFRTTAEPYLIGQVLTVGHFKVGDAVDVIGVSKGKGFQGVIKRHGKHGGPASHGSTLHRSTGSIGQRTSPGEVFKNMKLPGHMGDDQVTVRNLKVVQLRPEENLLFVRGAVPGANKGLLVVKNRAADFEKRLVIEKKEESKDVSPKSDSLKGDSPKA
ncbi:MAG: 50S ribosomal protein L3 [Deltaproteobacteria bacterium]|nr:50S ribosomal protein L3 [Deltaproteobacteria bacterium]